MAKTQVILTHSVVGLGAESDHVKVAAGYARNYLFPQGLAIPLTAANKRRLESLRQRRAERESLEFNSMSELAKGLSKTVLVLTAKTGEDGKMFGSITSGTIADELRHQFEVTVDKKKIHLEHPLRTVGEHEVELRLHAEVTMTLKVRIDSTTPPPRPAEPSSGGPRARGGAPRKAGEIAPAKGRETAKARENPQPEAKTERPSRKPRTEKEAE